MMSILILSIWLFIAILINIAKMGESRPGDSIFSYSLIVVIPLFILGPPDAQNVTVTQFALLCISLGIMVTKYYILMALFINQKREKEISLKNTD